MLSKLLSLHEQNLEFDSNLAEFYLHRCQAISLKIKYGFFIFIKEVYLFVVYLFKLWLWEALFSLPLQLWSFWLSIVFESKAGY